MAIRMRKANGTGAAAVAVNVNPGKPWRLYQVLIHLNAVGGAGAGNLTIQKDAIGGAAYDTILLSQDMTSMADIVYIPTQPLYFENGDQANVVWANPNGKTYGVEVYYSVP